MGLCFKIKAYPCCTHLYKVICRVYIPYSPYVIMGDMYFFSIYIFQRHPLNCIMSEWVDVIPVSTCSSSADKLCSCSSWSGKKKHWLRFTSAWGFCGFHLHRHSSPSFEWADAPAFYAGKMWPHGTAMHFPMCGWCY